VVGPVIVGAVTSTTVTICVAVLVFPQASTALHVTKTTVDVPPVVQKLDWILVEEIELVVTEVHASAAVADPIFDPLKEQAVWNLVEGAVMAGGAVSLTVMN